MNSAQELSFDTTIQMLTVGASITVGLLSFSGMFALMPSVALACASTVLAVAYEGEIYSQNIRGSLNKLSTEQDLAKALTQEYLCHHYKKTADETNFFYHYSYLISAVHYYETLKDIDGAEVEKQKLEQYISEMEATVTRLWQSKKTSQQNNTPSNYDKEITEWIESLQEMPLQDLINNRAWLLFFIKIFSAISGLCAGIGTTYLLIEAFTIIPFLATISVGLWPFLILPMAGVAGLAYALLTFNAFTDMITKHTWEKLWTKISTNTRSTGMSVATMIVLGLCITLTACTIGTWWTVFSSIIPLWSWMNIIPSNLLYFVTPVILGTSTFIFNSENALESLNMIDAWLQQQSSYSIKERIYNQIICLWWIYQTENLLQFINPFRIINNFLVFILTYGLFAGHLLSIGVNSDRLPGFPEAFSISLGIANEMIEDLHYIFGLDNHSHKIEELLEERLSSNVSHDHHTETLPSKLINFLTYIPYLWSQAWDKAARSFNASANNTLYSLTTNPKSRNPNELLLAVEDNRLIYTININQRKYPLDNIDKKIISYIENNTDQELPESIQRLIFRQTIKNGHAPKLRTEVSYVPQVNNTEKEIDTAEKIIRKLSLFKDPDQPKSSRKICYNPETCNSQDHVDDWNYCVTISR